MKQVIHTYLYFSHFNIQQWQDRDCWCTLYNVQQIKKSLELLNSFILYFMSLWLALWLALSQSNIKLICHWHLTVLNFQLRFEKYRNRLGTIDSNVLGRAFRAFCHPFSIQNEEEKSVTVTVTFWTFNLDFKYTATGDI